MTRISQADAVNLRSIIRNRISEYIRARDNAATVTFAKGEEAEQPEVSVEKYNSLIEEARQDYRALDVLMAQHNLQNHVVWDGREVTLMEAIQTTKDVRSYVDELKALGNRKKTSRSSGGYGYERGSDLIVQTTYEPSEMNKKAEKLDRQVNRLSRLIDRKNEEIFYEFAPAKKYMDVDDEEDFDAI